MASIKFTRPVDKQILDPDTKLIILEWDNFFNNTSTYVNNIQIQAAFTLTATALLVVNDKRVRSGSVIIIQDTNIAAATLQIGTKRIYVDTASVVPGVSFTVRTRDTTAAVGGETFTYAILG